jgi:predicted component of type VI protein secretion system
MAFLQVYFNSTLEYEVELRGKVTTVGRGADCDIVIDNSGVSELHARIRRIGNAVVLEDAASTNGDISVLKHQLRLVAEPGGKLQEKPNSSRVGQPVDKTTLLDANMLNDALGKLERQREAFLKLNGGAQGMRNSYQIKKPVFKIGKSRDCDLYTDGWFAPSLAARIQRRADGYYIEPHAGGKVRVNGMPRVGEIKLEDGDGLTIRQLALTFHERPST